MGQLIRLNRGYDLIVVGSGPSGAVASKIASEKGLKVLLFDKGTPPSQKGGVGGEFIPVSVFEEFPWMKEGPLQLGIGRWALYFPYHVNLSEIRFSRPAPYGFTVNRAEWDGWVAGAAVEAGAELKASTQVREVVRGVGGEVVGVVDEGGKKYLAPIVIGADGVNSVVARMAGLRGRGASRSIAPCVNYTFSLPPSEVASRFGEDGEAEVAIMYGEGISPKGFGWITPSKGEVSIGVWGVTDVTQKALSEHLQRILALRFVREKLGEAKLLQTSTHTVPLHGPTGRIYSSGILLTGDAAGLVCPFDGVGYEAAVLSGRMAAEVAVKAVGAGDTSSGALAEYESALKRSSIYQDIKFGLKVQKHMRESVGIEAFNKMLYEMGAAVNKHGFHSGKSHEEALTEFVTENAGILVGLLFRLVPIYAIPFREMMRVAFLGSKTILLGRKI